MEWYNFPDEMNLSDYEIRKDGIIRNIKTKYELTHTKKDYLYVKLSNNGTCKSYAVHILVAKVFLENYENKLTVDHIDRNTFNLPIVNHKDGNKLNNNVENLEWCTQKDNMIHFNKNNLIKKDNRQKKVYEYDNENNLINTFNSIAEASKTYNL